MSDFNAAIFEKLHAKAGTGNAAPLVKYVIRCGGTVADAKSFARHAYETYQPQAALDEIAAKIAACHECKGLDTSGWARGVGAALGLSDTAPVALIGESPGRTEAQQHVPFVGPAGKLLDEMLVHAGLLRADVFLTNTLRCFTTNKSRLTPEHAATCRHFLDDELRIVHPRAIICLGRFAWENFVGEECVGPLNQIRREWRVVEQHYVAFSYHPAAALHNKNWLPKMEEDWRWIGESLRRGVAEVYMGNGDWDDPF